MVSKTFQPVIDIIGGLFSTISVIINQFIGLRLEDLLFLSLLIPIFVLIVAMIPICKNYIAKHTECKKE